MIRELDHDEARSVLESGGDTRLGCLVDGEPYVVPMSYVLEGDYAYLHSLPGAKIDAMRRHPRVCLQVQIRESEYRWRSVQVFGAYEEIDDLEERKHAFRLLFERFPRLTPADSVRRYGHVEEPTIAFRIRIDRIVGVGEG